MTHHSVKRERWLPARREFAVTLDAHLKRGQRPETPRRIWKPWTNVNFAAAVGVSPNSVANWRNPTKAIPPDDITPVLEALFGDRAEYAGHRRDLQDAWDRAKGLLPLTEDDPIDDWVFHQTHATSGIAAVLLHQPEPSNMPDHYRLIASLRFDRGEYDFDDRTMLIGVREAFLLIGSGSHQPAKGSMIGDRSTHPNFEPAVGGVKVIGPKVGGHLAGDPIGDDFLAILEPTGDSGKPISVSLHAGRRSFDIALLDNTENGQLSRDTSVNKNAILNALICSEGEKDAQGRLILASASMRRTEQT